MLTLACVLAGLSSCAPAQTAFERFQLENGVRVALLEVPGAARQSTFTFLPLGLLHDAAGRAQYAHLVEHMLIRSTDPDSESLEVDGVRINGETGGALLRLETLAEPAKWREALERHALWLAAEDFDAAVLEREKGRIVREEEGTVANKATAKWALAAWNQIVVHEASHAAVHGDVQSATLSELSAYVKSHVQIGAGLLVVSVGPVDVGEVRGAIEESLGALAAQKDARTAGLDEDLSERVAEFGDREATWDLDAHHYLEWYPWPVGAPDRAASLLIGQRLMTALMQSEDPLLQGGRVLVSADLVHPGGRALLFSTSIEEGTDLGALRRALRGLIEDCLAKDHQPSLKLALKQAAMEMSGLPDFEALRSRFSGQPAADLIEAQMTLSLFNLEESFGLTRKQIGEHCAELDPKRVESLARKSLAEKRRASLVLRPAGKDGGN